MAQLVFAGAATVATLALSSAARPGDAGTVVAATGGGASSKVINVDDGGVNDNGQTSGDIFTQNAQDQSTA